MTVSPNNVATHFIQALPLFDNAQGLVQNLKSQIEWERWRNGRLSRRTRLVSGLL